VTKLAFNLGRDEASFQFEEGPIGKKYLYFFLIIWGGGGGGTWATPNPPKSVLMFRIALENQTFKTKKKFYFSVFPHNYFQNELIIIIIIIIIISTSTIFTQHINFLFGTIFKVIKILIKFYTTILS
jgi:hypothetical protein